MSKSITQDMAYRQSLMKYAEKYGVSRASRKYNKSRSYIYFWKQRWDGSVASLGCQSRRPHSHPNQHTEAELKLIRDMHRRNPTLGMIELWHRLRRRGYTRCPESLFRVMRRLGMFPDPKPKKTYKPKPYEQMTHPGERVQVDVKVVPRSCIADPELRLFQYTAIDEFTRLRFLAAYPEQSTYSSADFLRTALMYYPAQPPDQRCGLRLHEPAPPGAADLPVKTAGAGTKAAPKTGTGTRSAEPGPETLMPHDDGTTRSNVVQRAPPAVSRGAASGADQRYFPGGFNLSNT